jgi:molybdate transport system substrate-binding protein
MGMKRKFQLLAIALVGICAWLPPAARAGQITVAAAADLTFAFDQAAASFHEQTGNSVKLSFGSSGNFYSQIINGAPYDIFFSADVEYPQRLQAAGLTQPGTLYDYALGRIVVWVPSGSGLDLKRGLPVLLQPEVRKIAIANPQHAPYGRAALAALRHQALYDRIKSKLVLGENISQTAQFVASGSADVGIIALSLALAPPMRSKGRFVEIPTEDYPPIIQAAVILKSSRNQQVARQFIAFLQQPAGLALLERYGFAPPKQIAPAHQRRAAPG